MTNKELIGKLHNLQKFSPDQSWLSGNRELLLSQVSNSGAENLSLGKMILITLANLSKAAAKPAYALAAFVFLLITGSLLSQKMLANAKPNDSLYIARIIAEQVKINTTFNADARDKLAVQYATDHAQDISAVLADPKFNTPSNQAQVAALNTSFTQEVNTVKSAISRLTPEATSAPAPLIAVKTVNSKTPTLNNSDQATASDLIIADSSKDKNGIQLLEKSGEANISALGAAPVKLKATETTDILSATTTDGQEATGTAASSSLNVSSSTPATVSAPSAADKILDEAQKLFDSKDYNQAADKLKEIDNIIK